MARMSLDDKVARDPRITILAQLVGWSRRETLGCLVGEVWPICYDQETCVVSERVIDIAAGRVGFAAAMLEAELATRDRSGKVRIAGAKERIEYLNHKKRAGREGGLKSASLRDKDLKQAGEHTSSKRGSTPQAAGNPPSPVPVPVPSPVSASAPVPVPVQEGEESAPPAAAPPLPGFGGLEQAIARNLGDVGLARARGRKGPKPSDPTPAELASVRIVLDKLGERSGVRYSGTAEHTRLITARLREGAAEMDLRAVVGYCALELGWQDDPKMRAYLRPETLFGPKTIAKYLDAARAWFASLPEDKPRPALQVVEGDDPFAEPAWMAAGGDQ